jgi:LAS superfamily LD-carboxypeptidase LdcB
MAPALKFTVDQLTGRARSHLVDLDGPACTLHHEVVSPFLTLRASAAAGGIDLVAISSFRDFDRQLAIWNGKFRGERPMQDRSGQPLETSALSTAQRVQAILWWSALPGASRHHWGTDFDVVDAAAMPPGYHLRLVPEEYLPGGPFARLSRWLDRHMHAFGFFRPYTRDRGGVLPEPWHLSYAPVAEAALAQFAEAHLRTVISAADIEGRDEVLAALPRTWANYVVNVEPAPAEARLSPRLF